MANLYELETIDSELRELLANGEIDNQTYLDTLESLGGSPADKIANTIKYMRSVQADADKLKAEAKHFADRAKVAQNEADRQKKRIDEYMKYKGYDKLDAGLFKVSYRKNPPALSVTSEDHIPKSFYIEQRPTLDKAILKRELQNGLEIEGVELTTGKSLQIK